MVKITKQKIGVMIVVAQIVVGVTVFISTDKQYDVAIKGQEIINTGIASQTYLLNASLNIQTNIFSGINAILTNITTNETLKEEINKAYTSIINETQNRINVSNQVLQKQRTSVSEWVLLYTDSNTWNYIALMAQLAAIIFVIIVFFILPPENSTHISRERKHR